MVYCGRGEGDTVAKQAGFRSAEDNLAALMARVAALPPRRLRRYPGCRRRCAREAGFYPLVTQ